jgi:hypothetical protein
MPFVIVEEIRSIPGNQLLQFIGPIAKGETEQAAKQRAEEFASKFDHKGYEENARYPYYWGRNDGANQVHHYQIRSV